MKTKDKTIENRQEPLFWQDLKAGCSAALGNIAHLHYANLLRYGMTLGFDRETVKDAIQNTFIYIWEHRETIATVENGRAYLLFALRNRLVREQHQTKQVRTFWQRLLATKEVQQSTDIEWITFEIETENNQNIHKVIAQMSTREREVIQLRFYENLDNEAIAEIMGISKQGVANLLVRTLKSFRGAWQELVSLFFLFYLLGFS